MSDPMRDTSMAPPDNERSEQLHSSTSSLPIRIDPDIEHPIHAQTQTQAFISQPVPLSHLPRVQLHLSQQSLPPRIADGVAEIVHHHIREHVLVLHHDQDDPLPASGIPDPLPHPSTASSTSTSASSSFAVPIPVWKWNVRFHPDASINPLTWSCSSSSNNFAPLTSDHSNASTLQDPVEQPFVILIRYPPSSPHLAFRGLGHVLTTTKAILCDSNHLQQSSSGSHATAAIHPNLYPRRAPFDSFAPSTSDTDSTTLAATNGLHLCPIKAKELLNQSQTAQFETIGTMIDCSRNGVLNVTSTKYFLRTLAMLGYNMLQLYTEDTYEIPSEPFFGYMRGGYTQHELKQIDDYAFALGIEVIPCIQTLGHLGQMLQWPRYLGLRDTSEVLLPEFQETYWMLERMILSATSPFRSKKIHLGMDETHGLGHGRYYSIFGHKNGKSGSQIFVEHLNRVNQIVNKLGLQPMIWSDMLFCLSAQNNSLVGYYDNNHTSLPSDQASSESDDDEDGNEDAKGGEGARQVGKQGRIPSKMDLVYWDYYHTSVESYSKRVRNHQCLRKGKSPWMASGSWTWSRFWTALPFTFQTIRANLVASKKSLATNGAQEGKEAGGAGADGVKHVFLTIWGDEGNEVDLISCLPAWVYYAEHAYTPLKASGDGEDEVDIALTKSKFDALCGGNWDDFVLGSSIDFASHSDTGVLPEDDGIHFAPNTSKWLTWQDPVHAFVEPSLTVNGFDAEKHFRDLSQVFKDRLDGVTMENLGVSVGGTGNQQLLPREVGASSTANETAQSNKQTASAGLFPMKWFSSSSKDGGGANDTSSTSSGIQLLRILSDHPLNARLQLPWLLSNFLHLKVTLRQRLHEAYTSQNWSELQHLCHHRLVKCKNLARKLWKYHRMVWMSMYKAQGWETLELRYGGLVSRLDTLEMRIRGFLNHLKAGGHVGVPLASHYAAPNTSSSATTGHPSGVFLPTDQSRLDGTNTDTDTDSETQDSDSLENEVFADEGPQQDRKRRYSNAHPPSHHQLHYYCQLEELEKPLHLVYGSPDQLLDYHRVSRPTYC